MKNAHAHTQAHEPYHTCTYISPCSLSSIKLLTLIYGSSMCAPRFAFSRIFKQSCIIICIYTHGIFYSLIPFQQFQPIPPFHLPVNMNHPSPFHGEDVPTFLRFIELEAEEASGYEEAFFATDGPFSTEEYLATSLD